MRKKSPKNNQIDKDNKIFLQIEQLKKNNLINSYLGNKGYSIYKVCLNHEIIDYIKKTLTVKPFTQNQSIEPNSFPVYMESEKKIYIPRFWGINLFGLPKIIKISHGDNINLIFNGSLRDYQNTVLNAYLNSIKFNIPEKNNQGNSSALIELYTGSGKTILALKIVEQIKKKTIIFVQKTFLKNQWIERIQQFLPDAKIGCIQGPIIDIDNKDIVIAMVQSISMKAYPETMFDSFGLSIYDEVHHMSSEIFSNCLKKCTTLYSLGLSATMERKDGLTHVFKMYLGDICYKNKAIQEQDNVLVKAIDYIDSDEEFSEVERDFRGIVKYSTMISKLSKYEYRNIFILNVLENELLINNNQQIILLAHNKSLLNYLHKAIVDRNIASVGYYIGGMKDVDLKISEKKQIILATYQMAAEALDIKSLTTLFLATPKTDIVQAVGRILREKHSNPLVIDIIDKHEPFINQFAKRRSFYNEKNYKIIRTTNMKYIEYIKNIKKTDNYQDIDEKLYWNELIKKTRQSKLKNNIDLHDLDVGCLIKNI